MNARSVVYSGIRLSQVDAQKIPQAGVFDFSHFLILRKIRNGQLFFDGFAK
jgi:hypothetical protein